MFKVLLPENGSRPPKHVTGNTVYFLYMLCMCKLLVLILRSILYCTKWKLWKIQSTFV